jgi:hypothetical protein
MTLSQPIYHISDFASENRVPCMPNPFRTELEVCRVNANTAFIFKCKGSPSIKSAERIDLIKVSSGGLVGYSHDFHGHEPVFAVSRGSIPANPIGG